MGRVTVLALAVVALVSGCTPVVAGYARAASPGDVSVEPVALVADGIDQQVPPETLEPVQAWAALAALERAPVPPDLPAYDRAAFASDWRDPDANGCNGRQDVLAYWLDVPVGHGQSCVVSGVMTDPYTGRVVQVPDEVDVDHVVPLKEAWRSGAWRWDYARRVTFANDLRHLIPVYYKANRAKGDKPPHRWMPSAAPYWCEYAVVYIGTKRWYGLTVTEEEAAGLGEAMLSCGPR